MKEFGLQPITQEDVNSKLSNKLSNNANFSNTTSRKIEQQSIRDKSEQTYIDIVQDVVENSKENLTAIRDDKQSLRYRLIDFCLTMLAVQMIFLIIFLLCSRKIGLSDNVLSVYMTAVFVETLGSVIVMVKYAFKSEEEVKIIDILNAVVKNFQKYKDNTEEHKEQ